MENETVIRKILKNEITWIVMMVGGIWGFVVTVILPINTMQSQLAQIQKDLLDYKNVQTESIRVHQDLYLRLGTLETQVKYLK